MAILSFFNRLLVVIVFRYPESYHEVVILRKLVVRVIIGFAHAHHNLWVLKVDQAAKLNDSVEKYNGDGKDSRNTASQRLFCLATVRKIKRKGLAKPIY